ncbi:MAG: hypothetical protein U1A78_39200 [Polyangia bacterium]
MGTDEWLDARRRQITPTAGEQADVQAAIDTVRATIQREYPIAELHPCGSAAKRTMLQGRREADVVLTLRGAPTPQTLDRFRDALAQAPDVESATKLHKAVAVRFKNGVSVDVLPAAENGLTDPGGSIPRKHRHALDGPAHVDWFEREGHRHGAHDVVRLAKDWRNSNGLSDLSSVGLEVLVVNVLQSTGAQGLGARFSAVLEQLAAGRITVQDPSRSGQRINDLEPAAKAKVMAAAQASLEHLRRGEPHRAFAGPNYPSSLRGIADTPLA